MLAKDLVRNNIILGTRETEAVKILNSIQFRPDIFEHSLRVANFAVEITRELDLPTQTQEEVRIASLFHDIGKLSIPNTLLYKKHLTSQEWEIIRKHSQVGKELLEQSGYLRQFGTFVLYHHERFDGSGYPEGLKGDEIPFISQIIAVADSFDAMISYRPYRDSSFSIIEAIHKLSILLGTHYDPEVIAALENIGRKNLPSLLMCLF